MSAETREVGMNWMTKKLAELTQKAAGPVTVHWEADIANEHAQILVIEALGTTKKWEIANLNLEDDARRPQLEKVIQAVVSSLGDAEMKESKGDVQRIALPLTAEEQHLLVEVLYTAIPPLREEIVHATEDHAYRDTLRERERLLNVILEKLKEAK